jgi:hypothetical protein
MRREDIHTYRHAGKKRHTSNETRRRSRKCVLPRCAQIGGSQLPKLARRRETVTFLPFSCKMAYGLRWPPRDRAHDDMMMTNTRDARVPG